MRSAVRAHVLSLTAALVLASMGAARAEPTWTERTFELAGGAVAQGQAAATAFDAWVRRGYQHRPAVIVGLAAILALPPLSLAGWFVYRRRPAEVVRRPVTDLPDTTAAYVDVDGAGRFELTSGRDLMQIFARLRRRLDEMESKYRTITAPTLMVVGELDLPDIVERHNMLSEDLENAFAVVLEDTAHFPSMERPDLFNPLLLEFLEAVTGAGEGDDEDGDA